MTLPFPRYLGGLTWEQCFSFGRNEILAQFVTPLTTVDGTAPPVRKLACLLLAMMNVPSHLPQSTAILKTFITPQTPNAGAYPVVQDSEGGEPLGTVHWQPSGRPRGPNGLHLYCRTIHDLLAACMSEAAHIHYQDAIRATRTDKNFFAPLVSLFSHWCAELFGVADRNRRPTMASLATVNEIIILGCTIPQVPGFPGAKDAIQQARLQDIKRRGRVDKNGVRVDARKVLVMLQDYGHCAETWSFALLCNLSDEELLQARGIAVRVPNPGIAEYVEQTECSRYAPPCVNCERMFKQIVRWGEPTDKVVEKFSVHAWTPPRD